MKLQKDDRVYIKTKSGGRIAMENLRPGDWIGRDDIRQVVLQNSAVLGRIELMWEPYVGLFSQSYPYGQFTMPDNTYFGRGKKRWWYDKLPRWLRKHFMPYSKPE